MEYFVPRELIISEDSYTLLAYLAVRMMVQGRLYDPAFVRTSELIDFIYNGETVPANRVKKMRESVDRLLEAEWVSGAKDGDDAYLIKKEFKMGADGRFVKVAEKDAVLLLSRSLRREVLGSLKTYLTILTYVYSKTRVAEVALSALSRVVGVKPKALISHIKLLEDLHLLAVGRFINNHKMGNVYARYADKEYVEKWIGLHNTAVR